jgi:hypothetical protein
MNFVMLAIFVTFVAIAAQYPPQARFMPFVVGFPAIGLCILQIFLDLRAMRRNAIEEKDTRSDLEKTQVEVSRYAGRQVESEATEEEGEIPEAIEASIPPNSVHREVTLWAYFISLVVGILLFGFWISIPIFLLIHLHFEAKLSWIRALLTALIATGILYLAVAKGLRADLHPGFVISYFDV